MEQIPEQIIRMKIPDSDMPEWMRVLREGGMSAEEIDAMMIRLNDTYRAIKTTPVIDQLVTEFKEFLIREHKYHLNDDQEREIRSGLEQKFGVTKE